jgi:hypothetical protein
MERVVAGPAPTLRPASTRVPTWRTRCCRPSRSLDRIERFYAAALAVRVAVRLRELPLSSSCAPCRRARVAHRRGSACSPLARADLPAR